MSPYSLLLFWCSPFKALNQPPSLKLLLELKQTSRLLPLPPFLSFRPAGAETQGTPDALGLSDMGFADTQAHDSQAKGYGTAMVFCSWTHSLSWARLCRLTSVGPSRSGMTRIVTETRLVLFHKWPRGQSLRLRHLSFQTQPPAYLSSLQVWTLSAQGQSAQRWHSSSPQLPWGCSCAQISIPWLLEHSVTRETSVPNKNLFTVEDSSLRLAVAERTGKRGIYRFQ